MIWQQGQLLKSADLNAAFAQSFPASAVSAYSATVLAQIDNAHWLSLLGIPNLTTLGAPNGIATLDGAAHLTSSQVPPILPGNFSVKGPKPWIDVVAYGAVGNGIADDTGAINSAIAALPATGGLIYFPPGTYLVSGTILITQSSVKLMGAGIGVSIIQTSSTTLDVVSFGNGVTQYNYLSVSDLSIWSSVVNTAGAAIKLNDVTLVSLSRVEIEGTFNGINAISATYVVLDSITIKNPEAATGTGIIINGGNNYFLDKILVYTTSTQCLYGLQLLAAGSCWIDNSHFISTGYGIIANPASAATVQNVMLNNSTVESCTNDGIFINPASGGIVQGIRCSSLRTNLNSGNGINIGTTGTVTGVQCHGCQVLDNALAGINLQSGTYSLVDGCYIGGNSSASSGTSSGIKVAAAVSGFDIRTCRIGKSLTSAATHKYGIEIAAGASDKYAIIGNDLNDNVTGTILDGGTGINKQFLGNFPAAAETKAVIGGTLQLSHYGAGTLLTDASGNVSAGAAIAAAFVDSGNTSPAGTASTSFVMMGIGSTASITPATSGRILVVATGGVFSPTASAAANGAFLMIRRGTGTAPVNGAAVTGTQISTTEQCTFDGQNFVNSFATHAIVTGLSVGVAIWLDIALSASSASFTAQIANVKITAIEF